MMTAKHKFVMSNILSSSSAEFLNRKKERSCKGLQTFGMCWKSAIKQTGGIV
jgi:hypothetical protein